MFSVFFKSLFWHGIIAHLPLNLSVATYVYNYYYGGLSIFILFIISLYGFLILIFLTGKAGIGMRLGWDRNEIRLGMEWDYTYIPWRHPIASIDRHGHDSTARRREITKFKVLSIKKLASNLRRRANNLEVRLFYFIQAVAPPVPCISQTVEEYQLQRKWKLCQIEGMKIKKVETRGQLWNTDFYLVPTKFASTYVQ